MHWPDKGERAGSLHGAWLIWTATVLERIAGTKSVILRPGGERLSTAVTPILKGELQLDAPERVEVEALMAEVKERVEARRKAGEYGDLDDSPSFAELAMYDDLAASANRMAAAARTSGLVPPLAPTPPGREGPESAAGEPPRLPEGLTGRVYGMARRVADMTVGPKLSNFLDRLQQFLATSADNSRITAERVIALEARVDQLEGEVTKLKRVIKAASSKGNSGEKSEAGKSA